jgi:hypothetical protein
VFVDSSNQNKSEGTYLNPPKAYVRGKVEAVDVKDDKSLVKISVGTDQGVHKASTMEVYRLTPRPEYLGRLLIVDASADSAIGRLLRDPGRTSPPAIQPGDEVTNKVTK